jgi:phage tail-like protein
MASAQPGEYLYLNLENIWKDFRFQGLELRPDGTAQLSAVPRLDGDLPPSIASLPIPSGPAGLVFDEHGGLYFTLPDQDDLRGMPDCAEKAESLPCLSGSGAQPGQLKQPRGLAYDPARGTLVVADSGNHRLSFLSLPGGQIQEVWGSPDDPGGAPWSLEAPFAVAIDARGYLYVIGNGSKRLQKFDRRGAAVESFWKNASASVSWERPVAIAVASSPLPVRVFVLDAGRGVVVVLDQSGNLVEEFGAGELREPLGLAVDADSVYVGDNQRRQVLRFQRKAGYLLSGAAAGYEGPIAALALDGKGNLWVHPGGGMPLRMVTGQAFGRSGVLWGGPFGTKDRPILWHTLKAWAKDIGAGSHLQLFIATCQAKTEPPANPLPLDPEPFHDEWIDFPLDVTDVYIPFEEIPQKVTYDPVQHRQMPYIWVGFHFSGDSSATPLLHQARLTYNHQTYRQHLPAIFSADPDQADLLDRFLSLFESLNLETETRIDELRRYFDPQTAPPAWLRWLAGWLALDLDGRWSETQQRDAIRHTLKLYRLRGTPIGLREALSLYLGIEARIAESIQFSDWWSLADDSPSAQDQPQSARLGFTTRLAPAQDDGAVLGGTAQLDASYLETGDRFGAPLFENVAHQFAVQVYSGQVSSAARRAQLEQVIEREKPAHTLYHLCVIEPKMRVGFQSLVGFDTVLGGPKPDPARLDGALLHPQGLELGGEPVGKIGESSQVGADTRLA